MFCASHGDTSLRPSSSDVPVGDSMASTSSITQPQKLRLFLVYSIHIEVNRPCCYHRKSQGLHLLQRGLTTFSECLGVSQLEVKPQICYSGASLPQVSHFDARSLSFLIYRVVITTDPPARLVVRITLDGAREGLGAVPTTKQVLCKQRPLAVVHHAGALQTPPCCTVTWGLGKTQIPGRHPIAPDSAGAGWGPRSCVSVNN